MEPSYCRVNQNHAGSPPPAGARDSTEAESLRAWRRRALSRSTSARRPSRTRRSCPSMPVNRLASLNRSSSMFTVVLTSDLRRVDVIASYQTPCDDIHGALESFVACSLVTLLQCDLRGLHQIAGPQPVCERRRGEYVYAVLGTAGAGFQTDDHAALGVRVLVDQSA